MKIVSYRIFVLLSLVVLLKQGFSQASGDAVIFTDRDHVISGDTVWFKASVNRQEDFHGNVVHMQLSDKSNQLVSSVATKSMNGWAGGYILIPDSLQTGVYFLSAWRKSIQLTKNIPVMYKSLFVYNRFQQSYGEAYVPAGENRLNVLEFGQQVPIFTGQQTYKTRDRVNATINLSDLKQAGVSEVVIRAALVDEVALKYGGRFSGTAESFPFESSPYVEKDGLILSGRIYNAETGASPEKMLVMMSLKNDPLFFDYDFTGTDGRFHFFLKDAEGTGEIILQLVSDAKNGWAVVMDNHQLLLKGQVEPDLINLPEEQSRVISGQVKNAFYSRLFSNTMKGPGDVYHLPAGFSTPFYGSGYREVIPAEFDYLPDFQEISRELLPNVQFRYRNDEITIRILNQKAKMFFESEPLRLISGIPVFDNRILAGLSTNEIDKIHYVTEDRVFGDLRFNGVLAVYHKEKTDNWLVPHPGMFIFKLNFLQPVHNGQVAPSLQQENIPDFRTVFFWQKVETGAPAAVDFILSDVRGDIEISVEGITPDGQVRKTSKIISVK